MNKDYSILMQIGSDASSFKDLHDDFGFVCTEIKEGDISAKELAHVSWSEEDGLDVYIPSVQRLDSMEISVSLCYVGTPYTYHAKINALLNYLTGRGGTSLDSDGILLYSHHLNRGFSCCYFKELTEKEVFRNKVEEFYESKLSFVCASPMRSVVVKTKTDLTNFLANE